MKVIRAERNLFVPINPEKPEKNEVRLVATGLIALIPDDFSLPDGSFQEVGRVKLNKKGD